MKNALKISISVAVIIGVLAIVLKGVPLGELAAAFAAVRWVWVLIALLIVLLVFWLRAWRWALLLRPLRPVTTGRMFQYYVAGFFGNFLPARAGEFIRAYIVSEREQIPYSASLATIVLERLIDMFFVLLLLGILFITRSDVFASALTFDFGGQSFNLATVLLQFGYISFALSLGLLVFSLFLHFRQAATLRCTAFCLRPFPAGIASRVDGIIRMFVQGLGVLGNGRDLALVIVQSAAIWLLGILTYVPFFYACNAVPATTDIMTAGLMVVVFVAAFITIIPSPGFLGSYQLACTVAIADVMGVARVAAVAYGFVAWATGFVPILLLGPVYLMKFGISLSRATRTPPPHQ